MARMLKTAVLAAEKCAFLCACRLACLFVVAALMGSAAADPVDDWAAVYLRALKAENNTPPLGARSMAIYSIAAAEAVNAIEHRWRPYLANPPKAASGANIRAAIAGAAYRAGVSLYPSRRADFEALWTQTRAELASAPGAEAGFNLGMAAADAVLNARAADGSNTQVPYIPTNSIGAWRRTPPWYRPPDLPHWGLVRPFVLTHAGQYRPPGPPAISGKQYLKDYNLTKSVGAKNSPARTPDQTQAARFWSDFTGTVTPPGHWTQIALALSHSNQVSLVDKVRLLALVNVALADAGIASWDAKYAFNFWRPVTAFIREDDGNPETVPDPTWESLLPPPSFPEYVSGHSTFSGAGGEILRRWFRKDRLAFSIGSDTVPGVSRSFKSISAAVTEVGMSRIWGGIHFHSADADGQELGRRVADWVFDHLYRPI